MGKSSTASRVTHPRKVSNSHIAARITRSTKFVELPDWLSRNEVRLYVGISLASADALIRGHPHRFFGKHLRISKYLLAPDVLRTKWDAS